MRNRSTCMLVNNILFSGELIDELSVDKGPSVRTGVTERFVCTFNYPERLKFLLHGVIYSIAMHAIAAGFRGQNTARYSKQTYTASTIIVTPFFIPGMARWKCPSTNKCFTVDYIFCLSWFLGCEQVISRMLIQTWSLLFEDDCNISDNILYIVRHVCKRMVIFSK